MKKLMFLLLFCLSSALPAHARITLGVVPSAAGLVRSEAQAQQLAGALEQTLRQDVVVRVFEDEVTLHDWLQRFRTVDIAILSRAYLNQQAAGEFQLIVDYWRPGQTGLSVETLVARQGFNPALLTRIQTGLLSLGDNGTNSPVLEKLKLDRFVLPGTRPLPEPSPFTTATPAPPELETQAASPPPAEAAATKSEAKEKPKSKPEPKPEPKPKAEPKPKPEPKPKAEPKSKAEPQAADRQEAAAEPPSGPATSPSQPLLEDAVTKDAAGAGSVPPPEPPAQSGSGGLYLFLALLLTALTAAAGYLVWQLRRLSRAMLWFSAQNPADRDDPPGED